MSQRQPEDLFTIELAGCINPPLMSCVQYCSNMNWILGYACWSDEDYVGRVSRLSRRVSAGRLVTLRVMSRALMQYRRHFAKGHAEATT